MIVKKVVCGCLVSAFSPAILAQSLPQDTVRFFDNPSSSSYTSLRSALTREFGSHSSSVVSENTGSYYQVEGSGPVDLDFWFLADTGGFKFSFGYYVMDEALAAIDTSTDVGRGLYAVNALSPGSATLLFDDRLEDPISNAQATVNGGDVLGFFLVPNATLDEFQRNSAVFEVNSTAWNKRWPLFSDSNANPAGKDQLLSFSGESVVSQGPVQFFGWEDLTRSSNSVTPAEMNFHDMVFTVEGATLTPLDAYEPEPDGNAGGQGGPDVVVVPEPGTALLGALGVLSLLLRRRRLEDQKKPAGL